MRGGKPTVPENITGTLTSSDYNSAHTSSFTTIMYKQYTVAIFKDPGRLLPINYVCIVALAPNLQRASFYSVIEFLPYSTTIKLLPLHNTHKGVNRYARHPTTRGSHHTKFLSFQKSIIQSIWGQLRRRLKI
jgi:hypothetical protein